jgi:hypothetical protein
MISGDKESQKWYDYKKSSFNKPNANPSNIVYLNMGSGLSN